MYLFEFRGWFDAFASIGGRWRPVATACLSLALAAGCTALPASGPSPNAVINTAALENKLPPYALIQLSPEVVARVGQRRPPGLASVASSGSSPRIMLGVGDIVSITIFEAAAGGLFIPDAASGARPGNFVQLPDQAVDNSGNITVPYAGAIKAVGRSIPDIQDEIVDLLGNRAIEPQVVITLKEQKATQVSVLGAVNSAGRFPINPAGDKLLDVIAKAGGPTGPEYETYVTLQRGGREATENFSRLVDHPGDNIYVRAGDTVVLSRKPETFVALGASGRNGQFPFEAEQITLAEALGKAGGPLDSRANPSHVFLYREEERDVLESIGYSTLTFATDTIPTIYTVDVRDPAGYFLASKLELRDKDVLYIANASTYDIGKVFSFIRSAVATGRDLDPSS